MKIKLSKKQWEEMGKTAGWIKSSQVNPSNEYSERMHTAFKKTFSDSSISLVNSSLTFEDVAFLTLSNGMSIRLKLDSDFNDAGTFDIVM